METVSKTAHRTNQQRTAIVYFGADREDYLKRAEADVLFDCSAGDQIRNMIQRAKESGGRVTEAVEVIATCPEISDEPVAKFEMGLSLKVKSY